MYIYIYPFSFCLSLYLFCYCCLYSCCHFFCFFFVLFFCSYCYYHDDLNHYYFRFINHLLSEHDIYKQDLLE